MNGTVRDRLVEFLEKDLIGPAHGEAEELEDPPKLRYIAGVLFPRESVRNEAASAGGVEVEDEDAAPNLGDDCEPPASDANDRLDDDRASIQNEYDDVVTLANTYRPSAMALSFLVEPTVSLLVVRSKAAVYASRSIPVQGQTYQRTIWTRVPLMLPERKFPLVGRESSESLVPGLEVRMVVRPARSGKRLVTVSLYNTTVERKKDVRVFFQCGFEVVTSDGTPGFPEYAVLDGMPDDPEETVLAMLYRRRRAFAVGHGCAARWDTNDAELATHLRTAVMPAVVVPPIVPLEFEARGLNMQFLGGDCEAPSVDIPAALEELCAGYETWIGEREKEIAELDERFRGVAQENLESCRCALRRMRGGVDLLAKDQRAREAFMLTNRVMAMQQHHSRLRRKWAEPWVPLPGRDGYRSDWKSKKGCWRAFQIAFVLMTIPGLVPGNDMIDLGGQSVDSRDVVDLIWFPTGGGKTEAYLAVTAFAVFTARLYDKKRTGCLVLMRYTLRLLTSQQFQRAASLVCACELIRRSNPARFGSNPVSIGLWVGASLTPNTEADAIKKIRGLRAAKTDAKNPFQLLSCPWCGTELENPEHLGYVDRDGRQLFLCPAKQCPFSARDEALPVCVVDESVYESPPTLLIGTVDKFALLAWKSQAGRLFEVGGGPEIVIQDELHLIAGPLGSMVGLYESVIDYLCSHRRRKPKIIASTATIRRAREQCKALYDRPVFQFPPSGLDASDSYFAVEDKEDPGRLYVGILPTASSSPLTAQIRTIVALQQGAPLVVRPGEDDALDPYWTLVQYFGSLKELGRAATFVNADIPEFLPTMHRRWGISGTNRRYMSNAEELTSRKDEDEIPKILARLETKFRSGAKSSEQALDTVLATSMISVGVDVPRLGVMLIVTQPKGTSEYIQASSRVGRRHPGLVVTLYNAGRPRDRSHYEHFCGYHTAFYRHVEPTSVTPFSPPAMERGLHGLLVIAGRHIAHWQRPTDLKLANREFTKFLDWLRNRIERIDPDHLPEFDGLVERRLQEWSDNNPKKWGEMMGDREERVLMRVPGTEATDKDSESWETPTSMRNVDVECGTLVIARYPAKGAS